MLYVLKNPAPSQPRHVMIVAADAKAIGMVGGMKVGGTRKPRTTSRATDCKVTRADGTTFIIPARTTTAPKQRRHKVIVVPEDRRPEQFRAY